MCLMLLLRHAPAFIRTRPRGLRPSWRLHGVLSRSSIMSAVKRRSQQQQQNKKKENKNLTEQTPLTRNFLVGAVEEALQRQSTIMEALELQMTQQENELDPVKATRRSEKIKQRADEVNRITAQLIQIKDELNRPSTIVSLTMTQEKLSDLGFAALLRESPAKWSILRSQEFGRPSDFYGLVFYSPLGVPILVGRRGAHSDATLRRIAQGSDIWFQVHDYQGSRVLLRSSRVKGTKDSKECRRMAANLAAFYSDARHDGTAVRVMYTDSKHVAKRGSKQGQLRQNKTLGSMLARPNDVAKIAANKEP